MLPDILAGNAALKQQLSTRMRERNLSHAYLISGSAGSGKHTLARLLAAALECTGNRPPCGTCRACRKILAGTHPDVVVVDDPEKVQVQVDLIRQARSDIYVRPNEGRRKIFLIPRAQSMNPSSQNALLKVLEEPPEYGTFLLLADTPEKLLPTIRSRCVHLRLSPLERDLLLSELARRRPDSTPQTRLAAAEQSGGFLGQALELLAAGEPVLPQTRQFAAAYASGDAVALLSLLCSMERLKRHQLAPVLEQLRHLLGQALSIRSGRGAAVGDAGAIAESHTASELLRACRTM